MFLERSSASVLPIVAVLGMGVISFSSTVALAGVGTVSSPSVEKGEVELETKGFYAFDYDDNDEYEYKQEYAIYYGFTKRLKAEVEVEFEKEHGEDTVTDGIGLYLQYEITEPGEAFFDSAVKAGYEFSGTGGADRVKAKLILKKEITDYELKSNIQLSQEIGDESEDGLIFDASLGAYREIAHDVKFGVEYFADVGNLDNQNGIDEQGHYIGPVIEGEMEFGEHTELEASLGYFQGMSDGADDGTIRYEVELKF